MTLNLVRTGPRDSEPVLLLHSAGLDLTYWDRQIEALRIDHDVIAVDLPGHGRSTGSPQDMHVPTIVERLTSVMADLEVPRLHVIGLSVGGVIAQALAVDAPAMIASLTLVDSGACFAPAAQSAMRARAATIRRDGLTPVLDGLFSHWFRPETLLARPDLVDRAVKTLSLLDDDVHAALWEMIADFDGRGRLSQICAPTTVLVGEHDTSSPIATARQLAHGIAGARLHVIPGAAHLSPIERPAEINAILATVTTGIG